MANPDTISVRVGEELLRRVNKVAEALGKSQAQFVKEVLDERTREHAKDVEEITKSEKKIVEREQRRGR
jgi:predicted DNA-binding protein